MLVKVLGLGLVFSAAVLIDSSSLYRVCLLKLTRYGAGLMNTPVSTQCFSTITGARPARSCKGSDSDSEVSQCLGTGADDSNISLRQWCVIAACHEDGFPWFFLISIRAIGFYPW